MSLLINEDDKARCLCGLPLFIDDVQITPITIKDIIELGENKYNAYLTMLIMPTKIFRGLLKDTDTDIEKELSEIDDFDLLALFCSSYPALEKDILESFSFFIKKKVEYDKTERHFKIVEDDIKIDRNFYNKFVDLVKLQTYMFKEEDIDQKNLSKKAKEMIEQRKKSKEQIKKLKNKNVEPLKIEDYISIIISKSHEIDVQKCLNMTVYNFFNYIERQALIDNYDIGIKQIFAGTSPEKVNLKHWLSKL